MLVNLSLNNDDGRDEIGWDFGVKLRQMVSGDLTMLFSIRNITTAAATTAALALSVPAGAATTVNGATGASGTQTHQFTFSGGNLVVNVNSAGTNPIGDPYIWLFADNGSPVNAITGALIGFNDDSFGTLNSYLNFSPLAAGNYIAVIAQWPFNDESNARAGIDPSPCIGCTYDLVLSDGVTFGAVPEPATWAMMIFGFGMVGGALRRRKQAIQARIAFA